MESKLTQQSRYVYIVIPTSVILVYSSVHSHSVIPSYISKVNLELRVEAIESEEAKIEEEQTTCSPRPSLRATAKTIILYYSQARCSPRRLIRTPTPHPSISMTSADLHPVGADQATVVFWDVTCVTMLVMGRQC